LTIQRAAIHLMQSVGLNPVEAGNHARHLLIEIGRHLSF
jgi:hypothetical protein